MSSDDTIETFIAKVEENAEMLKDLKEPISNKMIITKILMSLPSGYNYFISAWESTPEQNRKLEDLTNNLILEQSRLNINNDATAFVSKKSQKLQKKLPGKCFKCNKVGHWKKDCPLLQKCKTKSIRDDEDAFVGESSKVSRSNKAWLVDSGASEHMTFHREWFINFKRFSEAKHVRIGDGTLLEVSGEGEIDVLLLSENGWKERYLKNVLYVPGIKVNLFSTTSALEKGFTFTSTKN